MSLPDICTPEIVADYLQIPVKVVKQLCKDDEITNVPISPKRIRIERDDVLEYVERKKCQSKSNRLKSLKEQIEKLTKSLNTDMESVSGLAQATAAEKMLMSRLPKSSLKGNLEQNVTRIRS